MSPSSPIRSLFGALLLGVLVFGACFLAGSRLRTAATLRGQDELDWLRTEFRLSGPEMDRIRKLHNGYRPGCDALCERVRAKNRELESALRQHGPGSREVERILSDSASLRAECQVGMLRHFQEIAGSMPTAQGKRYLEEMERLTLGLHPAEGGKGVHPGHDHP